MKQVKWTEVKAHMNEFEKVWEKGKELRYNDETGEFVIRQRDDEILRNEHCLSSALDYYSNDDTVPEMLKATRESAEMQADAFTAMALGSLLINDDLGKE